MISNIEKIIISIVLGTLFVAILGITLGKVNQINKGLVYARIDLGCKLEVNTKGNYRFREDEFLIYSGTDKQQAKRLYSACVLNRAYRGNNENNRVSDSVRD